jgi:hypothetical protein
MNDKIRELLKESGFCFWADEEWGPGVGKIDWNCDYEKEFDRFVELMIAECIGIVDDAERGGDNEEWDNAIKFIRRDLKEHFGIGDKEEEFENWCRESDDGGDVEKNCKTHPDAPHGFSRNASHNADRYVCECEHWEEPK